MGHTTYGTTYLSAAGFSVIVAVTLARVAVFAVPLGCLVMAQRDRTLIEVHPGSMEHDRLRVVGLRLRLAGPLGLSLGSGSRRDVPARIRHRRLHAAQAARTDRLHSGHHHLLGASTLRGSSLEAQGWSM